MISKVREIFTLRNFATFVLVLFCIRYIPIETRGSISTLKTVVSAICAVIFLTKTPYATKAFIVVVIYYIAILLSAIIHIETFRASTILYLGSFLISYIALYNLVHINKVFSLSHFTKIVKYLIYAYAIVLVIQQAFIIVGIKYFPLINLCQILDRGIGANSLSGEPSTFARILGVLMYSYMECISYRNGYKFDITQLFKPEHRYVSIAFFWCMLTMGSGTAFIILGILSLYFINLRNAILVIPLLIGLIYLGDLLNIKQFERAYQSVQATMTLSNDIVVETDGSASSRIVPMLNTINNLDLTKKEHLFGYGIDYSITNESTRMIGEITDYGFIAYLLGLILVFTCSIRFFSIPTIMFFAGVGGGTANIAYQWGILMVFMCVRYFHEQCNNRQVVLFDTPDFALPRRSLAGQTIDVKKQKCRIKFQTIKNPTKKPI